MGDAVSDRPEPGQLTRLERLAGLDLRSLGAFRIVFGLILLQDLALWWRCREAMLTDFGVLPRAALFGIFRSDHAWTLFAATGSLAGVSLLLILQALALAAFILGYRTRIATLLCFLFWSSLHVRIPPALQGGDDLILLGLFWGLFCPLGARFSIDANHAREEDPRPVFLGVGSVAILIQLLLIYWCAVAFKLSDCWLEGRALAMALEIDYYARAPGQWLKSWPGLTRALTHASHGLELLGPLLLLIPLRSGRNRTLCALLMIGFHFGIWLTMVLGGITLVCGALWILVLPGSFWDSVAARFPIQPVTDSGTGSPKRPPKRPPGPLVRLLRRSADVFALAVLVLVIAWNLRAVDEASEGRLKGRLHWPSDPEWRLLEPTRPLIATLGLIQSWSMFAPYPVDEDGWFVIVATRADGTVFDLYNRGGFVEGRPGPIRWEKPEDVVDSYVHDRWSNYLTTIWLASQAKHRVWFGRWLTRATNRRLEGDRRVKSFDIYFVEERTGQDLEVRPPKRHHLHHHECF